MAGAQTTGRRRGIVWENVTSIEGNSTQVKCNYCDESISNRKLRIESHMGKCKRKREIQNDTLQPDDVTLQPDDENPSSSSSSAALAPAVDKRRRMDSFVTKTSNAKKDELDLQVARFYYANNISFNTSENEEWIKLCHMLRPGYKPPSRHEVGGPLLDKVFEDVNKESKEELKSASKITICQDGWSSVSHDPILAHSYHTGTATHLHSVVDCGANKKDAPYCFEKLKEAIAEIKEQTGKEVIGCVTDNENKMLNMRELLAEENPKILTWGCQAHYLNLLEHDLELLDITEEIQKVQKHFRNCHRSHGLLKEKGGKMPVISNDTRWNSKIASVESFIENHPIYTEIIDEMSDWPHAELSANFDAVSEIVSDNSFMRNASKLLKNLKKFSAALDKMQADSTTLADAIYVWIHLFGDEKLSDFQEEIGNRFTQAYEPFFFLAFYTDHRYVDEVIEGDDDHQRQAEKWLSEYNPDFLQSYVKYQLKDRDLYPEYMFSSKMQEMPARKWWSFIKQKAEKRNDQQEMKFAEFMVDLHSCPSSSASLERFFSTFGFVWSKTRNRLGHQKAFKLVKIYRHLRSST